MVVSVGVCVWEVWEAVQREKSKAEGVLKVIVRRERGGND